MEKFKGEPFYNRKMARMVLKNIALGQAEGHASARMAAAFKEYQERHKNKEATNGTADSV
ncbi:MAG: hypothetical protein VZR53_10090 [Prevotella sp.]|nr:hypothetical protein [Prevotella sp.]